MRIEPSGVVFVAICDVQTEKCIARVAAPITAVWTSPARVQVNVCRPRLEEQVRAGEWEIRGAKSNPASMSPHIPGINGSYW